MVIITDRLLQLYRTECKKRTYTHMMEGTNDLNVESNNIFDHDHG